MKSIFNVPADLVMEFAEGLVEHELTNEIIGTTTDNELVVEVEYSREERDAVNELMDLVDTGEEDGEEEED